MKISMSMLLGVMGCLACGLGHAESAIPVVSKVSQGPENPPPLDFSGVDSFFMVKSIRHGQELFLKETFKGNGNTCDSCHSDGGRGRKDLGWGRLPSLENAARVFPRFRIKENRVITLSDRMRSCVSGSMKGTPPEYGSVDLNDLVAYLTFLANGKPITLGKNWGDPSVHSSPRPANP